MQTIVPYIIVLLYECVKRKWVELSAVQCDSDTETVEGMNSLED